MATIEVILPLLLTHPEGFTREMREALRPGLDAEVGEIVTDIKTDPKFPRHTGHLSQAMAAQPARLEGEALETAITNVVDYADVQDRGRRPGARSPPSAKIRRWVELQMRDDVNRLARDLQSRYAVAHPRKRKGKSRAIGKYRQQAVFMITRAVIRKLKLRGMKGKAFVSGRVEEIAQRVRDAVQVEIDVYVSRKNGGTP